MFNDLQKKIVLEEKSSRDYMLKHANMELFDLYMCVILFFNNIELARPF